MTYDLLTPAEMSEADGLTIRSGRFDGYRLMRNAGAAIVTETLKRFPDMRCAHVLCGPGNNGGDGYVVARLLAEHGVAVSVHAGPRPHSGSDAALALAELAMPVRSLDDFAPREGEVVIDALFGAGLARPVDGVFAEAIETTNRSAARVVAVDLPSGVSGDGGAILGTAIEADLTMTFFRLKPGHLLQPGRSLCGETVIADIGIDAGVIEAIVPRTVANVPDWWRAHLPSPATDAHKYSRGHVVVFSGGVAYTGAARLSARAAARAGAGAVTLLSPPSAVLVNATHLTSVMVRPTRTIEDAEEFLRGRKARAVVIGPGYGPGAGCRAMVKHLMAIAADARIGLVLDADALTSFEDEPAAFVAASSRAKGEREAAAILTPHEGEFARLFPGIAGSKLERARRAALRSGCVVVLKGPDTVIAAPDGRAAINVNGTAWLATAGSGDVLAGIAAGLLSQGMPPFEAAAAAVWLHAECGRRFGAGLIAEDLPEQLPAVLAGLGP